VRVGLSREGGRWRWYGFNILVLAQEGRQTLPEDEEETSSSSWFYEKEA
jgi:hypothetical protein